MRDFELQYSRSHSPDQLELSFAKINLGFSESIADADRSCCIRLRSLAYRIATLISRGFNLSRP